MEPTSRSGRLRKCSRAARAWLAQARDALAALDALDHLRPLPAPLQRRLQRRHVARERARREERLARILNVMAARSDLNQVADDPTASRDDVLVATLLFVTVRDLYTVEESSTELK